MCGSQAPIPRLSPTGSRSSDQRFHHTSEFPQTPSPRCEEFGLVPVCPCEPKVGSRKGTRWLGGAPHSLDLRESDRCLLWSRGVHSRENPSSQFDRDLEGFTSV